MSLGMLGKYERIGVLGRGVSGIVYLAKDTMLNKQVALKEVDVQAGDLRRFLEEARVMDRLRHPNIVRVNGVDRIDDKVVIDMEYIRGLNLQETLRAEGPLPIERALDIGIQILDALDYAHSMQTVHRDIKPANILLTREGVVKLADFGLAEILATNAYACGAGTYAYMAPEDFEEESHSDSQSDIWSVAVTMFEMMTAERPFIVSNPKSPFAWKRALETQEPRAISELLPESSPALDAVIARGLARDKDRRYRTAGEFRSELARLRADEFPLPEPFSTPLPEDATMNLQPMGASAAGQPSVQASAAAFAQDSVTQNVWARDRFRGAGDYQDRALERTRNADDGGNDTVARFPAPTPAEVGAASVPNKRRTVLGFRARAREARLTLMPDRIDFGAIRSGESRQVRVTARIAHLVGAAAGRVVATPEWLTVWPSEFESARQTMTVTVQTALAPTLGSVQDSMRVETCAGAVTVPVHVNILKPRPSFRQIAPWFVPLFGIVLAPALITATVGTAHAFLAPPAAVSSLGLGLMLMVIAIAADIGIGERLACGVVMTCMCFVLGLEAATSQRIGYNGQLELQRGLATAAVAAVGLGMLVFVQVLTARRWKFWGVVLAVIGLLLGGVCYQVAVS